MYEEDAVGEAVGGVIVKVGHLADGVEEMEHVDHLLLCDIVRSRHLLELAQRLRSCCRHHTKPNKTKVSPKFFKRVSNVFRMTKNQASCTMMGGLFFLVRMSTWRARIT